MKVNLEVVLFVFVESKIAQIENQFEEKINELQKKLAETAREGSKIEAEKVEYQSRLADREAAKTELEKTIEGLKSKMRKDVLKLMKENEENEKFFKDEKTRLQNELKCVNEELADRKEYFEVACLLFQFNSIELPSVL